MTDGLALRSWVRKLVKKALTKQTKYSTDETVVGTWIDGKPIYRKVVTGLSFSLKADSVFTVNIPAIESAGAPLKMTILGSSYIVPAVTYNVALSSGKVSGWTDINANGMTTIIVEYTKTTDTATT